VKREELEKLLGKIAVHDYPNAPIAVIGWQCDILDAFEALNEELKASRRGESGLAESLENIVDALGLEESHHFVMPDQVRELRAERDLYRAHLEKGLGVVSDDDVNAISEWHAATIKLLEQSGVAPADPKPAPFPDCNGRGYYATGDTDNPTQTQCERCHTVDPKPEASVHEWDKHADNCGAQWYWRGIPGPCNCGAVFSEVAKGGV
jgi:hypothetical protein